MLAFGALKVLTLFLGILFKHVAVAAHFAFGFARFAVGYEITIRIPCTAVEHFFGFKRFTCKYFAFIAFRTFYAQSNRLNVLAFGVS